MITYAYECEACGSQFEIRASIKDDRSGIRCECGAVPEQLITGGRGIIISGVDEYKCDPRTNVSTFRGRSAKTEYKQYEKVIETQRQLVKARRKAGKEDEDGCVFEGIMPAPLHDSLARTTGDIESVLKDPIPFLKKTGTYMGRD